MHGTQLSRYRRDPRLLAFTTFPKSASCRFTTRSRSSCAVSSLSIFSNRRQASPRKDGGPELRPPPTYDCVPTTVPSELGLNAAPSTVATAAIRRSPVVSTHKPNPSPAVFWRIIQHSVAVPVCLLKFVNPGTVLVGTAITNLPNSRIHLSTRRSHGNTLHRSYTTHHLIGRHQLRPSLDGPSTRTYNHVALWERRGTTDPNR